MTAPIALMLLAACGAGLASCKGDQPSSTDEAPIEFWHAFSPGETEALNRVIDKLPAGRRVETSLLSFARGRSILARVLRAKRGCPDLARIDATWLPGLANDGLIARVPDAIWRARGWTPEAAELASYDGVHYGLPQSLDGLVLITRKSLLDDGKLPWPPRTLGELEAAAHRLSSEDRRGLGLRVDGYWFIAYLRAAGGTALDPDTGRLGIDDPAAASALERFAELFGPGGIAPPPPAPDEQTQSAAQAFAAGKIAILLEGPWAFHAASAGDIDELAVAAMPPGPGGQPAAPRGGQIYVVPACAESAEDGWELALALTARSVQIQWARAFGAVPTTRDALAEAPRVPSETYAALQKAAPLPRHPASAEMFDDLTPAIEAVVFGDASAEEALEGVARSWTRLLARHQEHD